MIQATKEMGNDPEDINNGLCTEWAERVEELFPQAKVREIWGHAYIRYAGKNYDAEHLNGDLKITRKQWNESQRLFAACRRDGQCEETTKAARKRFFRGRPARGEWTR